MKAPALAIMLGHSMPKGTHDPDMGESDEDHEQGKLDAADAIIEAIDKKDPAALVQAMGAWMDLHASGGEDEEEEE